MQPVLKPKTKKNTTGGKDGAGKGLDKKEKKAARTILRVLLWNRDYRVARPVFDMMHMQKNIVRELVETEKNYVSRLEICVKCFLRPL
jgi:bisphosphoglycerate-dependent phosphoglycerate mutase